MLAGELVAALRALRMKRLEPPALKAMLVACSGLGTSVVDRDLTADLQYAERILDESVTSDGEFDSASGGLPRAHTAH